MHPASRMELPVEPYRSGAPYVFVERALSFDETSDHDRWLAPSFFYGGTILIRQRLVVVARSIKLGHPWVVSMPQQDAGGVQRSVRKGIDQLA